MPSSGTSEHVHTPEAIARRLAGATGPSYVRDWIYGGIDGAVTTFAVAAGAAGAGLSPGIVVTLGIVNLVADGFSMAASNFSGTRAEEEELRLAEAIERRHVRLDPEGEREEIRQIFARKGFTGADLERAVDVITSDADRWIRAMLVDEYGLALEVRSPLLAAASTFAAFAVCGLVPIVPYVLGLDAPLAASCAATGLIFFGIGSARSRWSVRSWWRSGLETLGIGGVAAALAYAAGHIVGALTGLAG